MNNNFKKEILEKIEKEHIAPKPKWQFLLKNYVVWLIGGSFVIIGGLAISVIIFVFINSDWKLYYYLNGSLIDYVIKMAPFVWFILLALFIIVADYNFKQTKNGYKHSLFKIVSFSIIASGALGVIFYFNGLGYSMEYWISKTIPSYKNLLENRRHFWDQPDKGLLVGRIVTKNDDNFILESSDGIIWNIDSTKLNLMHGVILDNITELRVIGIKTGDNLFEACAIAPWYFEGGNEYLRKRMLEQMSKEGITAPSIGVGREKLNNLRGQFKIKNFDERNIFEMRINMCGKGTSTPRNNLLKNL